MVNKLSEAEIKDQNKHTKWQFLSPTSCMFYISQLLKKSLWQLLYDQKPGEWTTDFKSVITHVINDNSTTRPH